MLLKRHLTLINFSSNPRCNFGRVNSTLENPHV
jgi:hypothetical protein